MKNYLFLIFFLFLSVKLYSQVYDKTNDDIRIIVSDDKKLYTGLLDAGTFHLSLATSLLNEDFKIWTFHVSLYEGKMTIDKGRLLLIKFKDGSTMELKNVTAIGPSDYEYRITSYNDIEYYVRPSYELSEKMLKEMLEKDVVKIRIENNISYFDRKISSLDFKRSINKLYKQILKSLNASNDVREGF